MKTDYSFRTHVEIKKQDLTINHRQTILLLGSCFTDNIGEKMLKGGFNCYVNPIGTLYNPLSIAKAFTLDLPDEIDNYCSWLHSRVNNPIEEFHKLQSVIKEEADLFIITFGTAFVYRLKSTGEVVANCKKSDESLFNRERISQDEIADVWIDIIKKRIQSNKGKDIRFIFTVSPIRHLKDGLHENQLSKSTLLLAIDRICNAFPQNCTYFPSYEIVIDELRDYRFYADDMMHPSQLAIDYIWDRFNLAYMNKETSDYISKFEKLNKTLSHRPTNPNDQEYITLINETNKKIQELRHAIQH